MESNQFYMYNIPEGGGGGTPLYGLYRLCAAPKGMVFQPFWS